LLFPHIFGVFMNTQSTPPADSSRRHALQATGGLGLFSALVSIGMLTPGTAAAQAFNNAAFQAKGIVDAMKALGAAGAIESKDVIITASDIAENGAVVPVGIRSALAKTEMMALLVEKNPNGLAGAYDILDGADAEVQMNIKMGRGGISQSRWQVLHGQKRNQSHFGRLWRLMLQVNKQVL
jgi:sulfur-oxidizing protein SoxY